MDSYLIVVFVVVVVVIVVVVVFVFDVINLLTIHLRSCATG